MSASTTILNATGDFTLEWSDSKSDRMEQWINRKMKEGYSFFIVERAFFGLIPRNKEISDVDQIKSRKVKVSDDDMARLADNDKELFTILSDKTVTPTQNPDNGKSIKTKRRARSARDAARNHTCCVAPIAGG